MTLIALITVQHAALYRIVTCLVLQEEAKAKDEEAAQQVAERRAAWCRALRKVRLLCVSYA